MTKDISLLGAVFRDVPAVDLPVDGGGTARFVDEDDVSTVTVSPLSVTENGTYTAPTGTAYSPVSVSVSGGGGGNPWDGPDPTDGKTHIWIHIPDAKSEYRLIMPIRFTQSVANGVKVDWGDGTPPETYPEAGVKNETHTYAQAGDYEITFEVLGGTLSFDGENASSGIVGANVRIHKIKIKRVFFADGVVSSLTYTLYQLQGISQITLPSNLTSIGNSAFSQCFMLENITVPNRVTSIGNNAFSQCSSLGTVIIPSSVTSIGNNAFGNCDSMIEVHMLPTAPPTLGSTVFNNIREYTRIFVPSASLNAYKTASGWSTYASYMVGE